MSRSSSAQGAVRDQKRARFGRSDPSVSLARRDRTGQAGKLSRSTTSRLVARSSEPSKRPDESCQLIQAIGRPAPRSRPQAKSEYSSAQTSSRDSLRGRRDGSSWRQARGPRPRRSRCLWRFGGSGEVFNRLVSGLHGPAHHHFLDGLRRSLS